MECASAKDNAPFVENPLQFQEKLLKDNLEKEALEVRKKKIEVVVAWQVYLFLILVNINSCFSFGRLLGNL